MQIFEIERDDENWGKDQYYFLNATHRWHLPAVRCSACGQTWGKSMLAFGGVDISGISNEKRFRSIKPIPLEKWLPLRAELSQHVDKSIRLLPGVSLGPITGTIRGDAGDIGWLNLWTPLLSLRAEQVLRSAGLIFTTAKTDLKHRGKPDETYREMEFERSYAHLHDSSYTVKAGNCLECGFPHSAFKPQPWTVQKDSIPTDSDIFGIYEIPGMRLVSARFRMACLNAGLTNVNFRPYDIA